MAAAVVKEYLIPLFENEDKKYNSTKTKIKDTKSVKSTSKNKKSVYKELKLTEKLSDELCNILFIN